MTDTNSQAYNLTEDIRRSVISNSRQRCALLDLQGDAAVNKMEELHEVILSRLYAPGRTLTPPSGLSDMANIILYEEARLISS
jgi:hypothetical protein